MPPSLEQVTNLFRLQEISIPAHGQIMPPADPSAPFCGLLLEGTILLEYSNENGARRIADFYTAGDFFPAAPDAGKKEDLMLLAKNACRLAFLYRKEARSEPAALQAQTISALLLDRLLEHIYLLQQPTLRRKIQLFLDYQQARHPSGSFTLALSFTDCADYLAVDRSAMMRELRRMENERLLQHKGRTISLPGARGTSSAKTDSKSRRNRV